MAVDKSAGALDEKPEEWVQILRIFTWVGFLAASIPAAVGLQGAGLLPSFDCSGFSCLCGLVFILDLQRVMVWLTISAARRHTGRLNQPMLFDANVNSWGQRWRARRR